MAQLNIDELYRAAEENRLKAFETAQQDSLHRLQSSLQDIGTAYRGHVTQAQTAARISALGKEEKLAAAGLSSGNAYGAATSGYTETARVNMDNQLRSNLNTLSAARMKQEQQARTNSSSEIAQARQQYESSVADLRTRAAQDKIKQYNTDRQFQYASAMERWKTYGIVLPADAAVLGVPAGTRTASSAYDQARLALDRWKALL